MENKSNNIVVSRSNQIQTFLKKENQFDMLKRIIGTKANTEKYINGVITTIGLGGDKLQKCTDVSIFKCILSSAQLELDVDAKGHAYLVPFYNKDEKQMNAQLIPGFKGYLSKINENKNVKIVHLQSVYKGDKFQVSMGTNHEIIHVPDLTSEEYGKDEFITHVYCIVKFNNNEVDFEVMTREQTDIIKNTLKFESNMWNNWYGEMAKKSVVRRISKRLQLSNVQKMAIFDNSVSQGNITEINESGEVVTTTSNTETEAEMEVIDEKKLNEDIAKGFETLKIKGDDMTNYVYALYSLPNWNDLSLSEKQGLLKMLIEDISIDEKLEEEKNNASNNKQ